MPDFEFIDVYDGNRQPTGAVIQREGAHLQAEEYVLYAYALIENADGRFLATRRSLDKHWAAGAWEVPGGGVLTGETTQAAIVREVGEEVGLDVSALDGGPVYSYQNTDAKHHDNYFADVFHFHVDVPETAVTLQKSEAIDYAFLTWDEITRLFDQDAFLHYARLKQALEAEGILS